MDKLYVIKRLGLVDYEPDYLMLMRDGEFNWVSRVGKAEIYELAEDAFVELNRVKRSGAGTIDYCVMEIEVNEVRVELTTKPAEEER